jgi:adenylate cyclase class 2
MAKSFLNVEIKASVKQPDLIRQILLQHGADFKGVDHQSDTYYKVPFGRLKLRQGNIENNLIFYQRKDLQGPKSSDCELIPVVDGPGLNMILATALGVKKVVKKQREIYFIDNVKFHIDFLEGLGNFVEIEAGNKTKPLAHDILHQQCRYYMELLGIREEDLVHNSYSDFF